MKRYRTFLVLILWLICLAFTIGCSLPSGIQNLIVEQTSGSDVLLRWTTNEFASGKVNYWQDTKRDLKVQQPKDKSSCLMVAAATPMLCVSELPLEVLHKEHMVIIDRLENVSYDIIEFEVISVTEDGKELKRTGNLNDAMNNPYRRFLAVDYYVSLLVVFALGSILTLSLSKLRKMMKAKRTNKLGGKG